MLNLALIYLASLRCIYVMCIVNRQSTRDEEIDFYSHLRSTLESSSKNKAMLQSAVDDQITLLRFQAQLEKTSNLSFSKLSINQTLFKCIMQSVLSAEVKFIDWHGTIAKLVKAFQVPEKVVYQLKLQCFSRLNRFDLVQSLAQEKKPPCGYLPFALVCIDAKRSFEEIEYYIEKLPSFADKYPLYFHLKRWSRAAEIAAIARDVDKLKEVTVLDFTSLFFTKLLFTVGSKGMRRCLAQDADK